MVGEPSLAEAKAGEPSFAEATAGETGGCAIDRAATFCLIDDRRNRLLLKWATPYKGANATAAQ